MSLLFTTAVALLFCPVLLPAQLPTAPTSDASVLLPGELRLSLTTLWWRYDAWSGFTPSAASAGVPLGERYSFSALGVAALPALGATEAQISEASENPGYSLSLGQTSVRAQMQRTVTPLGFEVGVNSRITVTGMFPLVRERADIVLDVNQSGGAANAGFNPAIDIAIARAGNTALRNQISGAANSLQAALDACTLDPMSTGCATLLPREAEAMSLITSSRLFRNNLEMLFGSDTVTPGAIVPLSGSTSADNISARLAAYNQLYRDLLGVPPEGGSPISASPFFAETRLTTLQLRRYLEEPGFGIAMVPLSPYQRQGLGDIEIGARISLFDSFSDSASGMQFRLAAGVVGRLGTATVAGAGVPFDQGTGDGQNDIELSTAADLKFSGSFGVSLFGRYGNQLADRLTMRIAQPGTPFPELFTERDIARDLGDYIDFSIRPKWRLGTGATLSASYHFYNKQADSYSGTFVVPAEETGRDVVTLDASVLDVGTAATTQRAGVGLRLANFKDGAASQTGLPIELSFGYSALLSTTGYAVPRSPIRTLQLRVITGLLGG